jgi:RecA-family ATPase
LGVHLSGPALSEGAEGMEKKYEFTIDIQRKIVAMLFSDEKAFKENLEFIKPEYFENPPLREIVSILRDFFDRYGKTPTKEEFLEELETFINKEVKRHNGFLIDEYLDTAKKVLAFDKTADFDYVKDKVVDFARYQSMKHAIVEAAEKLLRKKDFEGIVRDINEAANVGIQESEVRCLADIKAEKVKWLWEDRIPSGKLSLLVGDPGAGKSFFTIFLASRISKGECWPDCMNKSIDSGRVLLLSAEDSPHDTIRPRADWAGADVNKIDIVECSKDKSGRIRLFNLSQDINRLEKMLKKDRNYKLVVIDPLSAYVGRIDTHRDSDVRSTLGPLSFLAEKYNVSVLGVLHFNKNSSLKAIYRILGSIGFIAAARTVWLIARDRDDENEKRRFFAPIKNNLAPPTKPLAFCIEKGRLVFESMPIENFDIEEVLAPVERASETKRAKDFLLDILRNGPMPQKEIKSTSREEGISWGTLRRAKNKMNIKSFKKGGIGGQWLWELMEVDRLQRLAEEEAEKRTKSEEEN